MTIYPLVILDEVAIRREMSSQQGPAAKSVAVHAIRVESAIKRHCPVDRGRLRASITWRLASSAGSFVGIVGSDVEYAAWVNRGTGIYGPHQTPVVPVSATFLRFKPRGSDEFVYRRSVRGMPGRHFMEAGVREVDPGAQIIAAGSG